MLNLISTFFQEKVTMCKAELDSARTYADHLKFKYARLIARRELFVEIVNYVLKFLSFRVQVIWNFIFVVLLHDKYVIIYCSLSKGPVTCGHEKKLASLQEELCAKKKGGC
jgi:hypothetical protein